jgi:hypothetical protein
VQTWRRSLVGLAAVVTAGALVAGACGGDDDDAADSQRGDAPEQAAGPDSDATATTTTTIAGGATDDGAAGSSAEVDQIGEMDFCDGFRAAIRLDSTTALAGARQLEAPAEIADDWQVFLDFAETSMSDEPPAGSPAEVAAAGQAAEEATGRVLAYVGQECGYSVDATTGEVTGDGG